ncbi:uncharacterized protein BDR25DRAFT_350744 [Lindgomyces ingoldianus]|uniref:Uncharacterized protein n=1 Tax=Lindgomyces ingoldianus TaxID=673940 RepID=A0ACB6R7W3_9PLEO|nr:uncharacterized protein BDR25DRAFT_350744 [Lindgomyces ingoldianus]KAF2475363.1 hypothetical protein BDR25DRAFT_350744 [Lindgomyces ingoldianus]
MPQRVHIDQLAIGYFHDSNRGSSSLTLSEKHSITWVRVPCYLSALQANFAHFENSLHIIAIPDYTIWQAAQANTIKLLWFTVDRLKNDIAATTLRAISLPLSLFWPTRCKAFVLALFSTITFNELFLMTAVIAFQSCNNSNNSSYQNRSCVIVLNPPVSGQLQRERWRLGSFVLLAMALTFIWGGTCNPLGLIMYALESGFIAGSMDTTILFLILSGPTLNLLFIAENHASSRICMLFLKLSFTRRLHVVEPLIAAVFFSLTLGLCVVVEGIPACFILTRHRVRLQSFPTSQSQNFLHLIILFRRVLATSRLQLQEPEPDSDNHNSRIEARHRNNSIKSLPWTTRRIPEIDQQNRNYARNCNVQAFRDAHCTISPLHAFLKESQRIFDTLSAPKFTNFLAFQIPTNSYATSFLILQFLTELYGARHSGKVSRTSEQPFIGCALTRWASTPAKPNFISFPKKIEGNSGATSVRLLLRVYLTSKSELTFKGLWLRVPCLVAPGRYWKLDRSTESIGNVFLPLQYIIIPSLAMSSMGAKSISPLIILNPTSSN